MQSISSVLHRVFVVAAAFSAGVGVGLLLAPAAGDETRERISASAKHAATSASDQAHEFAEPIAERAREKARVLSERHIPLADDFPVVDAETLRREVGSGLPGA